MRSQLVKELVFGVKDGVPISLLPVMKHSEAVVEHMFIGVLVPSFALMPCLLTPSNWLADWNLVFFEMQK